MAQFGPYEAAAVRAMLTLIQMVLMLVPAVDTKAIVVSAMKANNSKRSRRASASHVPLRTEDGRMGSSSEGELGVSIKAEESSSSWSCKGVCY